MRQNLGWAVGYTTRSRCRSAPESSNRRSGLVLRPELAALSMAGASLIVAVNALMLKRLQLPRAPAAEGQPPTPGAQQPLRESAAQTT